MAKKFNTAAETAEEYWRTGQMDSILPKIDTEKYDAIPVEWCAVCKSLAIVNEDTVLDDSVEYYCAECGNTEIVEGSIHEWEELTKLTKTN